MTAFDFIVPGIPVAKGRPRFSKAGAFVKTYTPAATVRFEERVRVCALNAGVRPLKGAVVVNVYAYWPTKGTARKKDPRPAAWKPTRPDLDNVLKAVLDGLNGVAYHDDAQVVAAQVQKQHAAQGEGPRVQIQVAPTEVPWKAVRWVREVTEL